MLEQLFRPGAPIWTGVVPSGFGLQAATGIGNGPIGAPIAPNFAGLAGAMPAATQPLPGPGTIPANPYGYNPLVGLPAPSLLAAVAMRRGQPQGPSTDQEIEDFIYDALELLPGTSEVEVRCEGGRATLTGSVPHKRAKRDIGEIAWAIPVLNDVQNNLTIASRRRSRGAARDGEPGVNPPNRKQG